MRAYRYVEGEVQSLETARSDEYWSVNIKKGLLSLVQLKLNQKWVHVEPANPFELKRGPPGAVYPQALGLNPWPMSRIANTFTVAEVSRILL